MGKNTNYLLRIRPLSPSSFAVALFALLLATSMQVLFTSLGTTLYFPLSFRQFSRPACWQAFRPELLPLVLPFQLSGGHSCRRNSNSTLSPSRLQQLCSLRAVQLIGDLDLASLSGSSRHLARLNRSNAIGPHARRLHARGYRYPCCSRVTDSAP